MGMYTSLTFDPLSLHHSCTRKQWAIQQRRSEQVNHLSSPLTLHSSDRANWPTHPAISIHSSTPLQSSTFRPCSLHRSSGTPSNGSPRLIGPSYWKPILTGQLRESSLRGTKVSSSEPTLMVLNLHHKHYQSCYNLESLEQKLVLGLLQRVLNFA